MCVMSFLNVSDYSYYDWFYLDLEDEEGGTFDNTQ